MQHMRDQIGGWAVLGLAVIAVGLMAWEWATVGHPSLLAIATSGALAVCALLWPVLAGPPGQSTHATSLAQRCAECGDAWRGYPRVSFCIRCGSTKTANGAY